MIFFSVRYGSVNITHANVVNVSEVFTHAHYTPSIVGNDIALLKTSEDFEFDDHVSLICLEENVTFKDDQIFVGAGWGNVFQYRIVDSGNDTWIQGMDELSRVAPDVIEERRCN